MTTASQRGRQNRARGNQYELTVCKATAAALGVPYEELRRSHAGEERFIRGDARMSPRVKAAFPWQLECRKYDQPISWSTIFEQGFEKTTHMSWFRDAEAAAKVRKDYETKAFPVMYVTAPKSSRVWYGMCRTAPLMAWWPGLLGVIGPYLCSQRGIVGAFTIFNYRNLLALLVLSRRQVGQTDDATAG